MADTQPAGHDNPGFAEDSKVPAVGTTDHKDVELVEMGNPTPTEIGNGLKHRQNGKVVEEEATDDLVLEKVEFDPDKYPAFAKGVLFLQEKVTGTYEDNKAAIWQVILIVLLILYIAYFIYAMVYRFGDEGSIRLLVCTLFGFLLLALHLLRNHVAVVSEKAGHFLHDPHYSKTRRIIRWILYIVSAVGMVTLIIVLVALDTPRNLLSVAGLAAFIVLCFLTSHNPAMVNWHPVFWGFTLQFYFAVVILKTRWGYEAFKWLGERVTEFLSYSDAGAKFVFGDVAEINLLNGDTLVVKAAYTIHFFAFKVMPVITFFSTIIAVLYYIGVMQAIIRVIGRFLAFCLGTTPAESLNAAGNIFVSMTESPLMIRPFIPTMTSSELHAVMCGGFATIAGSVLGVYIDFGVPADHLLSASVMSAPAALAISKLTYPEVEVPIVNSNDYDKVEKLAEGSVIEAACNGAIRSGSIIASVIVNVIAFLSVLEFVNATLTWFGDRVGVEDLTFQFICSYLLYPVALFMGTEPADCRKVAELVGIKTFTNEFIAYQSLQSLIKNREDFDNYLETYPSELWYRDGDDIILEQLNDTRLKGGFLSPRSQLIATYALCGFSNFGSMGILLGTLSIMAPSRRPTMARIIFRAMIAGNVACFFTACIAGLFFEEFD
ncbi:solute carrier family 28 member 3 [Aplysia californica]|uniref:Sodium/nucleoside cotransporter n=1 Tax=Aplysia californica TaxID=6500 RepID=A0ABM1A3B0_APLCA|nr:solute carrier family 28 member 3 [Aplysia californica]